MYKSLGYWPVYLMSGCLNIFNIIYILFFIKNCVNTTHNDTHDENQSFLKYVIGTSKSALYACFRPRPLYTRLALFLLVLALLIMVFGFNVTNITFLYANLKFNWSYTAFTQYALFSLLIETLGTTICIGLFTKKLKINDYSMGLITAFFRVVSYVVTAFAVTTGMLYMGAAVNIGEGFI